MRRLSLILFPVIALLSACGEGENKQDENTTSAVGGDVESVHILEVQPSESSSSFQNALDQAKRLLAENKAVTIRVTEGSYYLNKPIHLGPEFSGTKNTPFTIQAEGQVHLSAGKVIKPNWQPHADGIVKTQLDIGAFDQLFVNGQKQHRARYPDFQAESQAFNGFAEDAISIPRVKNWKQPTTGFVHALHEGRWGGMHYAITGVDQNGELILDGGYQNNRPSALHPKYRFVENIFEELDAPNEWFFDELTSTLYFYPPKGLDLASAKFTVSNLNHVFEIHGSIENPVKHIAIQGFNINHTRQTFMQTREPLLRSDWRIYRGGAISITGAENIQIQNNTLFDLGGNAVFVSAYARNIDIRGNEIYNIGASAVSFVGDASAVRSPSFQYGEFTPMDEMDFTPGPLNELYPSNSTVHDNLIHDIGSIEKQVAGVQLSMAARITVSHNSIYRVPRAGINVSEGTWGGHIIEYNDVFETVLETGDHGAFNSWGRDRFWHPDRAEMDSLAQAHPGMWKLDVVEPIIIRNNRFKCEHGWDIDLDDGSSNYEIYNNVALNGGIKLREGFNRVVQNNIILNNSLHPHVWFKDSQDVFKHNIVLVGYKPILNNYWGKDIDYNYFVNESDLGFAQSLGLDAHSISGVPNFIDPETGDYRVAEDSDALKIGFKNFPMDTFGVVSPALKQKAATPVFPKLFLSASETKVGKTYSLLGATFKSVETLGEQSALGIPEIAGAMILNVDPQSKAALGGLKGGDVVLKVLDTQFGGEDKVTVGNDLLASYQARKWRGVLELEISRNQKNQTLVINLLD